MPATPRKKEKNNRTDRNGRSHKRYMTPPCKIRNPEYIGSRTDGLVIRFVIQKVIQIVIHPAPPVFWDATHEAYRSGCFTLGFRDLSTKKTATRTVRSKMVVGDGFEPSNSERADLQSAAFDHSAIPPENFGAGKGGRTPITSLEGWCTAVMPYPQKLVPTEGVEPSLR